MAKRELKLHSNIPDLWIDNNLNIFELCFFQNLALIHGGQAEIEGKGRLLQIGRWWF